MDNLANYTDNNIIENLNAMDTIISFQKDEIMKTEAFILRLQKCIIQQNEALLLFKNEKIRLEEEKAIALLNISENSLNCHNEPQIDDKERRVVENNVSGLYDEHTGSNSDLKRKNPSSIDNGRDKKVRILRRIDSSNGTIKVSDMKITSPNGKTQFKKISISQIGNEKITKIVKFKEDICFGGSGGILLKYRHQNVYQIRHMFNDDIGQIEIVKRNLKFFLLAFTGPRILIFDDSDQLVREIPLLGMGNVFNDISLIYIPLKNGIIKKLCVDDFVVKDHVVHKHGGVHCFVPGSGKNKYALLSLQDSLLYKSDKKDLQRLVAIEGTKNIKRIMRVRFCNFLCYSDNKIWFFNSEFDILKIVNFDEGIKFVDVADMLGAVVDCGNSVHLYRVLDSGLFGKKLLSTNIDGNITAMAIMKNAIMVAVGSEIFILDNKF